MSVVQGMSDTEYHALTSLSSSGARLILQAPAKFRWAMDNPPAPTPVFNLGHAFHSAVLGGREVVVLDHESFKTLASRADRDAALKADQIPLLPKEYAQVQAMQEAVYGHPLTAALLADGEPELSIFTTDPATGVDLRTRPDWTGVNLVDLKTTVNADPDEFGRMAWTYHYEQQAAWYLDEAARAGLVADDARFLFLLAEKAPPYLVSVVELDIEAIRIGRERNRLAIDTYSHCLATHTWPGYPAIEHLVPLPAYAAMQYEEEMTFG